MKSSEHNHIVKEEWVEKYLLHQLSKQDETRFEEHLLYCEECRKEIQRLEKIIRGVEHYQYKKIVDGKNSAGEISQKQKPIRRLLPPSQLIRIAASIVLILGGTALLYIFYLHKPEKVIISEMNDSIKTDSVSYIHKKDMPDEESTGKLTNDRQNTLLAEAFQTNNFYESMVDNIVRSVNFTLLEPSDSISVNPGQNVTYKWQMSTNEELELIIFTNKGEPVKDIVIKSPAKINDLKQQGLYYWKLDTHEETLAAGKIYVID